MLPSILYKLLILSITVVVVCASKSESELEQPTKLLGGTLKKPEKCKAKSATNSNVKIHYRARAWGQKEFFENTYLRHKPIDVQLGKNKIIKGIEDGVHGMCAGEIRRLLIPAYLAYGEFGIPNLVPPNTAIVADVEMIYVDSPFSNPWFWISGALLIIAFFFYRQNIKQSERSSPGAMLQTQLAQQQQEQEKKEQ
ncbi:FKBP-like protein [Rhizopus microsporus var. microsporus]|uniref:peptidylprolyl isomerase n=2 Tax=Rhizopus microsporus TaxID=58291 RepID=A0A2G4SPX7_RHIZD|nr:FKBP-like protein [Rhizopus microsporus ATCC 52813]ORE01580.1 FKBP-like protein [Rhizopus microsporus var. microsporus]PHZ10828.1 FKBP-like protein [Rhizopus microsporus ATCC 52813]